MTGDQMTNKRSHSNARPCAVCGKDFEAKTTRARYCGPTCRQRAKRKGDSGTDPKAALLVGDADNLVDAVRSELDRRNAAGSPAGQTALVLARRIGAELPLDTGSNLVAMTRELTGLLASIGEAPSAATDEHNGDPVDELTRRRAKRLAGAGK